MKKTAKAPAKKAAKARPRIVEPRVVERSVVERSVVEPTAERRERAARLLGGLKRLYPEADCALEHKSALELLVATILSAQSTDVNVNKVTPVLFGRFPDARSLAEADLGEVERIVHSTGFFRQKAKNILGSCRRIVDVYGGNVPGTMEDLVTLPGVARKTANVLLGTWFKKNEGVVVDTHVGRLARRMGLTWTSRDEKDAVKIEEDLLKVIPRAEWTYFGHATIWHGRRVCSAQKPDCTGCALSGDCPSAFKVDRAKETRRGAGRKKRASR